MGSDMKKETSLLDLEDGSLVEILDHLHDITEIIRLGAVNKRLHRLHFFVSRLRSSGLDLLEYVDKFLRSLARRGGCLREFRMMLEDSPQFGALDWIQPVSNTLRSLDLEWWSRHGDSLSEAGDMISKCTLLEKLKINASGSEARISPGQLKQIVDSCPRLRVLQVSWIGEGDLELVSSTLEQAELSQLDQAQEQAQLSLSLSQLELDQEYSSTLRVTLDAPNLSELGVDTDELIIRAHRLRKLKLMCYKDLSLITISPPLNNLQCLKFGHMASLDKMKKLLASIRGGFVDALHIGAYFLPREVPVSLTSLLEPLTCVRSLELMCEIMQKLSSSEDHEQGRVLTRLGIQEMVVEVDAMKEKGTRVVDQEQHLDETMILLRRFLASSSLRKLAITCCFTEYNIKGRSRSVKKCRRALKPLVEALREEFPGVVSVSYYEHSWD